MRQPFGSNAVGRSQSAMVDLLLPKGWVDMNLVNFVEISQFSSGTWNVQSNRVYPQHAEKVRKEIEGTVAKSSRSPYYYLAAVATAQLSRTTQRVAEIQTYFQFAALACAFERLKNSAGRYPETLAELVPQYITQIPHDLVTGAPVQYRKTSDRYMLYTWGWDGKDDSGQPEPEKQPAKGEKAGDWVWKY